MIAAVFVLYLSFNFSYEHIYATASAVIVSLSGPEKARALSCQAQHVL